MRAYTPHITCRPCAWAARIMSSSGHARCASPPACDASSVRSPRVECSCALSRAASSLIACSSRAMAAGNSSVEITPRTSSPFPTSPSSYCARSRNITISGAADDRNVTIIVISPRRDCRETVRRQPSVAARPSAILLRPVAAPFFRTGRSPGTMRALRGRVRWRRRGRMTRRPACILCHAVTYSSVRPLNDRHFRSMRRRHHTVAMPGASREPAKRENEGKRVAHGRRSRRRTAGTTFARSRPRRAPGRRNPQVRSSR